MIEPMYLHEWMADDRGDSLRLVWVEADGRHETTIPGWLWKGLQRSTGARRQVDSSPLPTLPQTIAEAKTRSVTVTRGNGRK